MKQFIFVFFLLIFFLMEGFSLNIYLFPGQGADSRLFSSLVFPKDTKLHYIDLTTPEKKESLRDYAYRLGKTINTQKPFVLIGVSMGGMICSELHDTLRPEKTIIISSAKCRNELPFRYRFQKSLPINKLVPGWLTKWGARLLQPLVEPDRKHNKNTFVSMLKSKQATYMKRTVNMIVNWNKASYSPDIIHIHGDNDHTLPLRNIQADYVIKGGSHMMTLTQADTISPLINSLLTNLVPKEKPQLN